jgi:plastocyanin
MRIVIITAILTHPDAPMKRILCFAAAALTALSAASFAADNELILIIKDHRFEPAELKVPAGQKIKITVKNQDATPAEFESSDLNREKVVGANSEVIVFIGPLDPGRYGYFDDFHRDTTTGTIIAK